MKNNPVQNAMDFLRACPPGEQRAVAIRTTGDGEFVVKTYKNATPQGEVTVGGKRNLDEALASLS